MHSKLSRLLNLAIRAATLGCRFLFIFFLAKLLTPEELGLYGLVTATIAYALYLVGLDFYTFTTRELVKLDRSRWGSVFKNHAALSLLLYAVVLPIILLVFAAGLLPWQIAKWLFVLIVLEHICQEMSRLFVAVNEQLFASMQLFLRQGSWAIVVTALMLMVVEARNLDAVFALWVLAGLATVGLGLYKLHRLQVGGWREAIDWAWIRQGVRIAIPLLLATLALRAVSTFDRYWLQELTSLQVVGAYVLFVGISGTLLAFLDAGVFAYAYPALIKAYHAQQPSQYRMQMRTMCLHTLVVIGGFAVTSMVVLPYLLQWIGNPVYLQYQQLFPWLLLAMGLNAIGMVPHFALYAQKQDRPIIQSHLWSLVVFALATAAFVLWDSLLAVPAGYAFSQLFILLWKSWAYYRLTPLSYRYPFRPAASQPGMSR